MEPIVVAKNLTKSYTKGLLALDNVSLTVNQGKVLVVMGPSGSGKSTLIRTFNGLETFDRGELNILGIKVDSTHDERKIQKIRRRVGMVFQQFNLFPHLCVMDNLTLGPMRSKKITKVEAESLAMKYLERVRIPEQARKFPSQLSGGQQQRVAIARSLCMEPAIMLFDEPTSALDPEMIKEVLDVMTELANDGMTMICVTHETGFARGVADTMVFMDAGEIVETAEPEKFFTKPETRRCQDFLNKILHH